MTVWFTADPHFGHKRIIELCKRPFATIEEMNKHLINEYNKLVKSSDILYILGDFAWGNINNVREFRDKINCNNIVFIWGNHDDALRDNPKVAHELFSSVHEVLDVKVNGQGIRLFHEPILEWTGFWRGVWHLFGHVHGNLSHMPGALAIDVGVDCHDYKPVSFEQLKVIMENRKKFNAKSVEDFVK